MTPNMSNYKLFKWFMIEEYRVLCDLFGKKRLALFPIMLIIISVLLGIGAPLFNFEPQTSVAVLISIIWLFGIQTGSLGFEARDMIDNLMGGSARILYSSRTLPITKSKLASIFLLKDALIYTLVMLLPIVSGSLLGIEFSPFQGEYGSTVSYTIMDALYLYIISVLSFIFGSSVGFAITTSDIGSPKTVILTLITTVICVTLYLIYDINIQMITEIEPIIGSVLLIIGTIISSLIGVWQFGVVSETQEKSRYHNYYEYLPRRVSRSKVLNVVAKSLVDIKRSPGGLWKLVFSTGIIVATVVFLVTIVENFIVTMMMQEFLYVGLLSMAVFPVYSIVYRYDSDEYYSVQPISSLQVRKAKSLIYLFLSYVIIGSFYTALTYGSVSLINYVFGMILLPFLLVYQLGIFLAVAKDEPSKFLFNGVLFGTYSVSMMFVIVPVVMVGLFGSLLPQWFQMLAISVVVASGIIGSLLTYFGVNGYFQRDS